MLRKSVLDYLAEVVGKDAGLAGLDAVALEHLRGDDLAGVRGAVVALVGITGAGKTSLARRLFGSDIGQVLASADTTDAVALLELPSGLVLVDTPGAGGNNEQFENVTRAFLGLAPLPNIPPCEAAPTRYWRAGTSERSSTSDPRPSRPDVCLLLIEPESGGFNRECARFYDDLRRADYPVVVVVTKRDRLNAQQRFELDRNIQNRHGTSPTFASAVTGEGLQALVASTLSKLPTAASASFLRQVERDYRVRRSDFVNTYVRRAAATAGLSDPTELAVEGLTRVQAIAVGTALRVALDMGVAEEVWASGTPEQIATEVAERLRRSAPHQEPVKAGTDRELLTEVILALPRLVKLLGRLLLDGRVSASDKALLGLAIAYVVSPIDLVPDFIPFVGQVDDVLVVALTLLRLVRRAGRDVIIEHWSGSPETLDFLVRDVPSMALSFLPDSVGGKIQSFVSKDDGSVEASVPASSEPEDAGYAAVELVYESVANALAGLGGAAQRLDGPLAQVRARSGEIRSALRARRVDDVVAALEPVVVDV